MDKEFSERCGSPAMKLAIQTRRNKQQVDYCEELPRERARTSRSGSNHIRKRQKTGSDSEKARCDPPQNTEQSSGGRALRDSKN